MGKARAIAAATCGLVLLIVLGWGNPLWIVSPPVDTWGGQ